ncbi:twin-arginine translocation signal domain-containing protein, partial [Salmonella enterica]
MSRTAKPQNGRRRFLRDVVRTAGGLAAVGVALGLQQQTCLLYTSDAADE